jgi:two-component system response regulator NreC
MPKIRLLLVDDHQIVRAGLRMLFQAESDMEIVGEVDTGEDALRAVGELKPDVGIKEISPDTAVLAVTMHEDEQYFFEMLNAGASGYIPKRAAPDDLVSAIRVVSQGEVFLYPSLAKYLVKDFLHRVESGGVPAGEELTPREREVLTYIAEGYTNREVADALIISVKTVDRHRENIMRKLNLHSRVELVKYAIEKGLISVS